MATTASTPRKAPDCSSSNVANECKYRGFSEAEQNYLRQAVSEMNQLIAARLEATGFGEFVPVDGKFAGHEICGNQGEWINAPSFSATEQNHVNDRSFHPNERGHADGYAAAINEKLR